VKAFDETGQATVDRVVQALDYALANGARVINASWGLTERSRALLDAVQAARAAGVLFVAAGGNEKTSRVLYPAAYAETLAVAATDRNDQRAFFSSYGPPMDLAAPGDFILSTLPNNGYDVRSGTSMATPLVSGAAVLVWSRHPEFTAEQVASILRNSTDPIPTDQDIGSGRLNLHRALQIEQPLPEARLDLPATVHGVIPIRGAAFGSSFAGYTLAYGVGARPTNWVEFHTGSTPVPDGVLLEAFDTSVLREGPHVFELRVHTPDGHAATVRRSVAVANVQIAWPLNHDILRAGERVTVTGTAFGAGLTYTLHYGAGLRPTTWSQSGIELVAAGQAPVLDAPLGTWDTRDLAPNEFYTLKLVARKADGSMEEYRAHTLYLESRFLPGWPQYVPATGDFPTDDWRDFVVADLDQDGCQEIVLVDPGDVDGKAARLLVYGCDGRLRWSRDLGPGPPYVDVPVAGDLDGQPGLEVLADIGGWLFAFHADGQPVAGQWPVRLAQGGLGKVLADLDGDGTLELIGLSEPFTDTFGTLARALYVFDHRGNELRRWTLGGCTTDARAPRVFPAVGNLDADRQLEIVAVGGCRELAAFDLDQPNRPLWTATTEGTLVASPVVGDVDQDGQEEIVVTGYSAHKWQAGGVYLFSADGQLRPGWPVLREESFAATPALADLEGDGTLEICVANWKSRQIHVLTHQGFEAPGWPVGPLSRPYAKSNGVVGDIDADGQPDLVFGAPRQLVTSSSDNYEHMGGVMAWNAQGLLIDLNPHERLVSLLMEGGRGFYWRTSPPVLTDLDGDGRLDVVAISNYDLAEVPSTGFWVKKGRSTICVWGTGLPFDPGAQPWPAFQRGPQHTGHFQRPRPPNQPPQVADVPDQVVPVGGAFFTFALDQFVSDPDDARSALSWSVSGQVELLVAIDANRRLSVRAPSPTWVGREVLELRATDPAGASSADQAVFEVRPGYSPPVAQPDLVRTPEDVPVDIALLANDSSPDGHPLRVVDVSRATAGQVTLRPNGVATYQPNTNFFGLDQFTYRLTDDAGGVAFGRVEIQVQPVNDPPLAQPDHALTVEGTPVTVEPLANDTDPDEDPLRLVDFSPPAHGTVTRAGDTLTYVPAAKFDGVDTFTYLVADPQGETARGEIQVLVNPVNDPPVATSQQFTLNRNSSQSIAFLATDPEGDQLTFAVVKGPDHGELYAYPASATYYPKKGFVGVDRFTYTASDGNATSQEATVLLEVIHANNLPTAADLPLVTRTNRPIALELKATDLDDDPLTFEVTSAPMHGQLTGDPPTLTYTPPLDYLGQDRFTYRAFDGQDFGPEGTVTIKVTDKNTAPIADNARLNVLADQPTEVLLPGRDNESDPLSFEIITPPLHGRLSGTGPRVVYTPAPGYVGPDRIEFRATDGDLASGVGAVTLQVRRANQPPIVRDLSTTVRPDRVSTLELPASDPDGDPLQAAILKGPQHGRLFGQGTTFNYLPDPGWLGGDSFTFIVWDGQTVSKRARLTITVTQQAPPIRLALDSAGLLADGRFRLIVRPGGVSTFALEASDDLVQWVPIATHTSSGEDVVVVDVDAAKYPWRFYRAVRR
jgi:subtilisin family serine protease